MTMKRRTEEAAPITDEQLEEIGARAELGAYEPQCEVSAAPDVLDLVGEVRRLRNERSGVVEKRADLDPFDEPRPRCGECGHSMTIVRPGKYQCDFCESEEAFDSLLKERDELRAALMASEAQVKEARAWAEKTVADGAAARVVTCVYCGQEYGGGTPTSQDERLTSHIKVCEKHPMRALQAECNRYEKALQQIMHLGTSYQSAVVIARNAIEPF